MRSVAALLAALLLAPLAVPALILSAGLASSAVRAESLPSASEIWLLLVGPAVPIYLVVVPLAPFLVVAQRRGWRPRAWQVVGSLMLLGLAMDLAFSLASRALS